MQTQCQHISRQAISYATGIYWLIFVAPILCDSQLLYTTFHFLGQSSCNDKINHFSKYLNGFQYFLK